MLDFEHIKKKLTNIYVFNVWNQTKRLKMEVLQMTASQFAEWVQEKFDSCNIHNEIETSQLIVEVMKKYFSLEREEKQDQ